MKRLTIIRHAKSSWDDPNQRDFDRPLNSRGLQAAPLMGRELKARGFAPDLIVSSPAIRALSTAKIIAELLGYSEARIETDRAIYEATVPELLAVVRALPPAHNHVMLFGHNPGFQELAIHLTNKPLPKMPTCGVVDLDYPGQWAEWGSAPATRRAFLFPKMFGGDDD